MARYHVNMTTGVPGICRAAKNCPFGLELDDHYDTASDARAAFEKDMTSSTLTKMKRAKTPEELRQIPATILRNLPLKEMDASQLAQSLQHETIAVGMDPDIISSSVDLATILHAHQTRGNRGNFTTTPYIEHPLRNALRLVRMNVTDQDVIVAAVLHDTIEDGASVFVKKFHGVKESNGEVESRKILGNYIHDAYGSNVLELVEAVTNDYVADTDKSRISIAQKNRVYLEHVRKAIRNRPGVILVKLSDFTDNATGLYHNDVPGREDKTRKQAMKYLPVVDVFLEELDRTELPVSAQTLEDLKEQLHKTRTRLEKIIARHSK